LNTHDPSDSGRPAGDIAHDSILDQIRHMQSLRFGKPFSQAEYDDTGTGLQGPQPQLSQRKLDLKGKMIAYISSKAGEGDAVVLRDLITGSMSMFHGDARERILSLALSTELLAFVTFDGFLHVVRFAEPGWSTRRRLPSAHVRALGVDGSTAAVAIGEKGCNMLQMAEVLLFDTESQRLRTLNTAPDRKFFHFIKPSDRQSLNSCSILVDSHREIIDLFSLVLYNDRGLQKRYLEIVHLRVNFAGENITIQTRCDELDEDEHVRSSHITMAPPAPTGHRGRFRIQVGEIPLLGGLPVRLKFDAIFDADKSDEEATGECGFVFSDEPEPTHYEVAGSPYRRDEPIANILHAQWKALAIQATEQPNSDWLEYYSLMNDTFLVSVEVSAARMQHSRIRVFCFDPKVNLHGGRSTGFWEDGELKPSSRWRERRRERSVVESDRMSESSG
jgi:hypothetical protein